MNIDYNERIPNNVDLAGNRALTRALEQWQPQFLRLAQLLRHRCATARLLRAALVCLRFLTTQCLALTVP